MIQNYSVWKVLQVFFDDPNPKEGFTVRWIAKQINLAPTSVKLHLNELSKEDKEGFPLIRREKGHLYPMYWPNKNSNVFKFYKKMDMLFRIQDVTQHLYDVCNPQVIILFGSACRGEDDALSDIDIFLLCKEKHVDVKKYELALKRKISLHFAENLNKIPKELRNNIINGIVLKGYIKVF